MFGSYRSARNMAAVCFCALCIAGCASEVPTIPPYAGSSSNGSSGGSTPPRPDLLQPAMTSIDMRVHAYQEKLQKWQGVGQSFTPTTISNDQQNKINECRGQLQHILLEYTSLRQQLQQEANPATAQTLASTSLLRLNEEDISYLESGCDSFLSGLQKQQAPASMAAPDPQIQAAFNRGDYDQVISLYTQLTQNPGAAVPAATTYQYGVALLKDHRDADASPVLNELLARIQQQSGQNDLLLPLLQLVADVDFARGAYEEARQNYQQVLKISIQQGAHQDEWAGLQLAALQPGVAQRNDLLDFSGVLKTYLGYVPQRDGSMLSDATSRYLQQHPTSALAPNINWLDKNASVQPQSGSGGATRSQISSAAAPAATGSTGATGAAGAGNAGSTPAATSSASETTATQGQQGQQGQAGQQQGQSGQQGQQGSTPSAAAAGAAATTSSPQASTAPATSQQPAAAADTPAAQLAAAQSLRQKAAELFVRASNTQDPEQKRKYLLSSRDLLQSILTKYPQSGLASKVQRNLARINADLQALGSR